MKITQGTWEPNNQWKTLLAVLGIAFAIFVLKMLGA